MKVWLPRIGRTLRIYFVIAAVLVAMSLLLDRFARVLGMALPVPYLVLVALAARWGGLSAAIFTCLATIPLVDFFLFEPRGTLEPGSRRVFQLALDRAQPCRFP